MVAEGEGEGELEGDLCASEHHTAAQTRNNLIKLTELLRLIQFFNSGGYRHCPDLGTEDGFCPGKQ